MYNVKKNIKLQIEQPTNQQSTRENKKNNERKKKQERKCKQEQKRKEKKIPSLGGSWAPREGVTLSTPHIYVLIIKRNKNTKLIKSF